MPELNSPRLVSNRDVIPDVTSQVRVINSLNSRTGTSKVADVMHVVCDDVVVLRGVIRIVDTRPSVVRAIGDGDVVYFIADNAHVRSLIQNSYVTIAADAKAQNINIVTIVFPRS